MSWIATCPAPIRLAQKATASPIGDCGPAARPGRSDRARRRTRRRYPPRRRVRVRRCRPGLADRRRRRPRPCRARVAPENRRCPGSLPVRRPSVWPKRRPRVRSEIGDLLHGLVDQTGHADALEDDIRRAAESAFGAADRVLLIDDEGVRAHAERALLLKIDDVLDRYLSGAHPFGPKGDRESDRRSGTCCTAWSIRPGTPTHSKTISAAPPSPRSALPTGSC